MPFFSAQTNTRSNSFHYVKYGPELLADGDMEAAGVADWKVIGGVLSKETSDPHGGTRNLRVTGSTANFAYQSGVLPTGSVVSITGYARGDGTVNPRLENNGPLNTIWTGTASTSWQFFSVLWSVSGGNDLLLRIYGGSGYGEFDTMSVRQVNQSTNVLIENFSRNNW